jgi:upstream activation factor subunit UAF30
MATKKKAVKKTATKKSASKKSASKTGSKKAAPKKAATKKTATRKAAPKKAAAKKKSTARKTARKPNAAFMAPLTPNDKLSAVVGSKPLARTEIVKKMWDYIKANKLQDQKNKRMINTDSKLKEVFNGKKQVSMFEVAGAINKNIKK